MTLLLLFSVSHVHIGLADGGRVVGRDEFPATRELASSLADRIRDFLEAKSYQLKAVEKIIVHAGPGGFTTLRIGVTTANTLAYALRLPIIGVTGPVASLDELLRRVGTAAPALKKFIIWI
jgi:tRNA threonylcarbamoyladenosine biosynthesis protein TsaB